MAGPMITALTFLVDASSAYAATTWNTPYTQIGNLWDSHVLNASQGGAVVYQHDDTHIKTAADYPQTTPRSTIPTLIRTAIDQLMTGWNEVTGTGSGNFHTASVPMNLTTINTNLTTNSTANATANTWVKRDGNAAIVVGQIAAVAYNTGNPAQVLRPASASNQVVHATYNNSSGGAVTLQWDSNGNLTATSVTATGAITGPLAATNVSDYKPSTNVSADTITVAAGGNFVDSSGNFVGAQVLQNVSLTNAVSAGQPTGTNMQWVAISYAPGSSPSTAVATGGVVGAAPAKPTFPAGNFPIAMVARRGATTLPSGIIAANDISDARNLGGGNSSGGTGGAPTSGVYWISGTNGSLGNALDSTNAATNGYIHPGLLKFANTQASIADLLAPAALPLQLAKAIGGGTNPVKRVAVIINPGQSITALVGGRIQKFTATFETADVANSLGVRYVILDTAGTPGTPGSALFFTTSLAGLTSTQTQVATVWYDGASLQLGYIDTSPVTGFITPYDILETTYNVSSAGVFTSATLAILTNCPIISYYTPIPMKLKFRMEAFVLAASVTPTLSIVCSYNGAQLGQNMGVQQIVNGFGVTIFKEVELAIASPGLQQFYMAGTAAGSTPSLSLSNCRMKVRFE